MNYVRDNRHYDNPKEQSPGIYRRSTIEQGYQCFDKNKLAINLKSTVLRRETKLLLYIYIYDCFQLMHTHVIQNEI